MTTKSEFDPPPPPAAGGVKSETLGTVGSSLLPHREAGRVFFVLLLVLLPALARATPPKAVPPTFTPPAMTEAWRVRIDNDEDGPIEVSQDKGRTWRLIGRVFNPATRRLTGYLAAGYAPVGCIAATSVHGIRIRVGDTTTAYPDLINIIPKEFAVTPSYFGGHIAGASGIYTDIPAGVTLFRELAPPCGSRVYLQDGTGVLHPLGSGYTPNLGDVLVILAQRLNNPLRSVVFENKTGGAVTATYADGTSTVITRVVWPVKGVGRFDGTSYTGVGAINTNHMCVVTVSTAPVANSSLLEGTGPERRGGFQIEPGYHNSQTEEASAPQVMILGEYKAKTPTLEGTPPLFFGEFSLAWSPGDLAHSWVCEIRTASRPNSWQPMPTIVGDQPDAFVKSGVIAFRLHQDQGMDDARIVASWIDRAGETYDAARIDLAHDGKIDIARGTMPVQPQITGQVPSYVEFYLDGGFAGMTNAAPYIYDWDTSHVADGEHLIEARAIDQNGSIFSTIRKLVWVDNKHKIR